MPKKAHGLGRGLDALIPVEPMTSEESSGGVQEISIGQIDPNQEQPRKAFAEDLIDQLAESIRNQGILQPLLVIPRENGRYTIAAGERRWRAAMKAGMKTVPCLVREMSPSQQMEVALIENLQREDLNPMEVASGIRALMEECGYTQEQCAQRLAKSRPSVANSLRLLHLPQNVQDLVREGLLSAGHARVLAGMEDPAEQAHMAMEVLNQGMSVRQLEQVVAESKDAKSHAADAKEKKEKTSAARSAELGQLENRIRETMGMRATLKGNENKGRIVIEYYTRDELEHLNEMLDKWEHLA
ncbi:MAG: ParB/RepB/Spo0J family partition protein [Clostridia bacterium]|nr:ParB/RepB/Spo0J family partition protein [Clostridia bacterium]